MNLIINLLQIKMEINFKYMKMETDNMSQIVMAKFNI